MKLPIGKIKSAVRKRGRGWTALEASFFQRNEQGDVTANMLLVRDDAPIVDYGYLARDDLDDVEDDGLGLVKLDVKLCSREGDNLGYVDVFVFDGEAYVGSLPSHLATELQRAIYIKTRG